ncbi:CYCD3 protein [Gonium pectorale]|uniref:CYCD3 protein n=1 Tax=Gonium pectorale TaxID=33097 RepID=A0A150G975_GONPE|nr:CYCD3 protein [Gonium pectorale]|eukprot:KXZ46371.1 CYCD3 protein [Gonium pectorale]
MTSPFLATASLLDKPLGKAGVAGLNGAREAEETMFGGCGQLRGALLETSCSDVAVFDSEADSFLWPRTASAKMDEDGSGVGTCVAMLECEDTLDYDDQDEDDTVEWAPGTQLAASTGPNYIHEDAERTLGVELGKEQELGHFSTTPLPDGYRGILVQWIRDVCSARALSHATFFSSVTLLDRFLRSTGEQQCASELLSLASDQNGMNLYRPEDYRMMELHLFGVLEYRLRTPTIYTFVCLFLHRVLNRPQDGEVVPPGTEARFRSLVLRLAELAALDHDLTSVPYSTLAVSCLLIAETEIKGGQLPSNLKTVESLRNVPGFPDMSGLSGPVQRLYTNYKASLELAA